MIAPRLLSVPVFVAAALGVTWAPAGADDAACQAVLQAAIKQAAVPVHQKITVESAAAPGKPMQSEMIRLGDTLYMQVGWPVDGAALRCREVRRRCRGQACMRKRPQHSAILAHRTSSTWSR